MSIALIFPGQGSQAVGMGSDVYETSAAARAVFDQADALLEFALSRLCFAGPADLLTATENAQPALLTVSVALLAALGYVNEETVIGSGYLPLTSVIPSHVAGHSLGEYTALVAGGALDFSTALRLVRQRGELMAAASEGSMAAIIGLDADALDRICRAVSAEHGPVVIANYNAPGQLVISGASASVEQACELAKEHGAKRVLPLKVSAAFHSPLMQATAEQLTPAIAAATVRNPFVPVISNVSAKALTDADAIRNELVAQITAPVHWIRSIEQMVAAGVDTFVEVGAGSVLTGLVKRIAPAATLFTLNSAQSVADWPGKRLGSRR